MTDTAPKGETDSGVCLSGGSRAASSSTFFRPHFFSRSTQVSNEKNSIMQNSQKVNGPRDRAGDVKQRTLLYRLCASGTR